MDNDEQRDYAEEEYNLRLLTEEHDTDNCDCCYVSKCAECSEPIDYCQGHADIYARCPWCNDDDTDEYSEKFCRAHLAEYEGLSVDELDRRDAEEAKDLL